MPPTRFGTNPLRALVWIETVCFILAFGGDIYFALTTHFDLSASMAPWLKAYVPLVALTAALVFSVPHAPNRRRFVIAAAIAASCATALIPSTGISSLVLLAVLAARLTFGFGLRGAVIAWCAAIASVACDAVSEHLGPAHLSVAESLFGIYGLSVQLALIFGIIGVMWLYAQRAASAAASAERVRIALDLHDSLGHTLTTLLVQLQNAESVGVEDARRSLPYVQQAVSTATDLLGDVRETVAILHREEQRPAAPLTGMLTRLHKDFAATHLLSIGWNVHIDDEPPGRVALAIYRVLQEALTNVARHARAKRVEVSVLTAGGAVEIAVCDDGVGFQGTSANGHGLESMHARIESIGGTLSIASRVGGGT
ncbi:MAG TPA: histidine kinase, partial [Candidatus Baltobacteraceae bacterium]